MPTPYRNLQDEHQRLLEWRENARDSQEFLNAVREYIERARRESQWVSTSRSRNQLRANLRFWASYLYDRTGAYPDTNLLPPADAETSGSYSQPKMEIDQPKVSTVPEPDTATSKLSSTPGRKDAGALDGASPSKKFLPRVSATLIIRATVLLFGFVWIFSVIVPQLSRHVFVNPTDDTPFPTTTTEQPPEILASSTVLPTFTSQPEPSTTPQPPLVFTVTPETLKPTPQPFPTGDNQGIIPETGGGGSTEDSPNVFIGQLEFASFTSCRSRNVTLEFGKPELFNTLTLDPANVFLTEAVTGNTIAQTRWEIGKSLTIDLPVNPAQATFLLRITHPQLTFSTHILSFGESCTHNTTRLTFDVLDWQPQALDESTTAAETPTPIIPQWTLLNWGPTPDDTMWVALLQVNAGENAFYWVSGDTLSAQNQPLMDGRMMLRAGLCEPAHVWVNITLGGETLRKLFILQAPLCR